MCMNTIQRARGTTHQTVSGMTNNGVERRKSRKNIRSMVGDGRPRPCRTMTRRSTRGTRLQPSSGRPPSGHRATTDV